jgi:hypothetical protein
VDMKLRAYGTSSTMGVVGDQVLLVGSQEDRLRRPARGVIVEARVPGMVRLAYDDGMLSPPVSIEHLEPIEQTQEGRRVAARGLLSAARLWVRSARAYRSFGQVDVAREMSTYALDVLRSKARVLRAA